MTFTPLRVVFELAAPVIPADRFGQHLDGLLAYAVVQDALLHDRDTLLSAGYDRLTADCLPKVIATDPSGVYQASMLDFAKEGCDHLIGMTRRTEDYGIALAKDNFDRNYHRRYEDFYVADAPMVADFPKSGASRSPKSLRMDKINLASGEHRNFQFFLPAFQARYATAWCIGDKSAIQSLLSRHIKSIGRKGAAGFGAVKRITVEDDTDAHENWKRRNMPSEIEGYSPVVGNLAPPYWKAENRQVVWVPV